MSDLIKRTDAIKAILSKPAWHNSDGSYYHSSDIKDAINNLPSIERPKGKWIHFDETKRFHEAWQCSNCYHDVIENPRYTNRVTGESLDFRFCPFCGAVMSDMREVKKRETD